MKEVEEAVVTTGAIRRAKLQSNRHHQQTNSQHFYRPDALPVAQQGVSARVQMTAAPVNPVVTVSTSVMCCCIK